MEIFVLSTVGMAAAALAGACAAEALALREALRLLGGRPVRRSGGVRHRRRAAERGPGQGTGPHGLSKPGPERSGPEREMGQSTAIQDGFDNLMRYTVETARGKGDGPCG